ncbi:MAG: MCE family protein [Solirubrobacterales bacterium]|nr:MCE family protein [Solirubrobacterales bacterium]
MRLARVAAVGALVLAIAVVAVLLLRGGNTHEYLLYFQNAGQLVRDDDVQVGGRRIGSVREITLTGDNQARVRVEVEEPYAPLHVGTRAVIRQTSLSGIANRYVALMPGPNSADELDDGGELQADSTTTPVDLDQLFNTLDSKTRNDLQNVIQGFSAQYDGKGKQANAAARYFSPALSSSRKLVNQLNRDSGALTRFLVNTSRAMGALAERRDDVAGVVTNSNTVAGAVAAESDALSQALGRLPGTLRKANTTFVNLRSTLDDLDQLVEESKPATRRLAPFLRELAPLVREARPTVSDLRTLIRRAGPDNDLVEATRKLPALQSVASPTFDNSREALRKTQPVLEFARPYAPDLAGWLRDFGQGAAAYDANGHYARIQPIFNAFSFKDDAQGGTLTPNQPSERFNGLQSGAYKRCPGSATQPPADGSAPFLDGSNLSGDECDPTLTPPGP